MASVTLEGVNKVYDGDVRAVRDVDLKIADGEFLVLVGPSGCGKTTLMRMIAGLEEVSEGSVWIGDEDVTWLEPQLRDVAMVFQNYALYPHMNVGRNLSFGLRLRGERREAIDDQVNRVAQALGLDALLERRPAELSGGQRQRVAMGRAIIREPKVYLMDEPLSNLDAKLRVSMRAQLAQLHARLGVTTVYVTHDQAEAMTLGQRVAVLRDGVLLQCDTPERLFDAPANLFVASFIGSPSMNLVQAELRDGIARFGPHELRVASDSRRYDGRVVIGVRPSDWVLAGPQVNPAWPRLEASISVVERLGSECYVVFAVDAPPVIVEGAGSADADSTDAQLLADDHRAFFTARLDGRVRAAAGDRVVLAVDPDHVYLFDPTSGALVRGAPTGSFDLAPAASAS